MGMSGCLGAGGVGGGKAGFGGNGLEQRCFVQEKLNLGELMSLGIFFPIFPTLVVFGGHPGWDGGIKACECVAKPGFTFKKS